MLLLARREARLRFASAGLRCASGSLAEVLARHHDTVAVMKNIASPVMIPFDSFRVRPRGSTIPLEDVLMTGRRRAGPHEVGGVTQSERGTLPRESLVVSVPRALGHGLATRWRLHRAVE